ncbi:MAG TPA: glycosyltransferase family 2 protein [Kiritimatiellia bacterium]|nr:glycosyltransferase family 2 protein [Kiritimatiellia bacterium]
MSNDPQGHIWCAIIPAYRETRHIPEVVRGVLAQGVTPIVVDDGSGDDTGRLAERAGAVLLRHERNQGKGAALQTGFRYAQTNGFTWMITMDADGQHDPGDLPAFLDAARSGACDVLIGDRMHDTRGMPFARRCTNRLMSALLSHAMGQRVPDTQCGYRAYRAELLPLLACNSTHFDAESEVLIKLARAGHRIISVPIRTIYRDERSKISPVRDTLRFLRMWWRNR